MFWCLLQQEKEFVLSVLLWVIVFSVMNLILILVLIARRGTILTYKEFALNVPQIAVTVLENIDVPIVLLVTLSSRTILEYVSSVNIPVLPVHGMLMSVLHARPTLLAKVGSVLVIIIWLSPSECMLLLSWFSTILTILLLDFLRYWVSTMLP